jgi:ribosomal protein S12 methylthiotransferase
MNQKSRRPAGRFYILTLGCPKNIVDSEGMGQFLRQAGYEPTDEPRRAKLLIVNTCGFLQAATAESLAALRDLARHKRKGQLLIAAGCLPQRDGAGIARAIPAVDGIISTRHWPDIVPLVRRLQEGRERPLFHRPGAETADPLTIPLARRGHVGASAYLKIGDGCNAPCAFCTIPAIKGPGRSRRRELILAEGRQLVAQGVQEIILIAQDTTAYGRDWGERDALPDLIADIVQAVPTLRWLRLMYAYPGHATRRLIEVMAAHPQVCHYLDLPLQHAHREVLRRMRRPGNVEWARRFIADFRAAMPDAALRTTFIVGYPGETESEFQALLDFIAEIAFDHVGVFTYSPEQGTPAAALPGQVPEEVKQERLERAMLAQQPVSLARNQAQVGRVLEVLVEGAGDGLSLGRTYRDAPEIDGLVLLAGELEVGAMLPVRITGATIYDLTGAPVP